MTIWILAWIYSSILVYVLVKLYHNKDNSMEVKNKYMRRAAILAKNENNKLDILRNLIIAR